MAVDPSVAIVPQTSNPPLTAQERASRSVFVGNIPYEATEEQLKDIFTQVGPVVSFRLVYDRETGKPKGYGFCEYQDVDTAHSAMRNLNNYDFSGRPLRVGVAAGEQNKDEMKGMQQAVGGPIIESPYGENVDPDKAPEAISKAVASLPPEQMYELMKQMKLCIQNNPNEARNMLLQNPQLAYALLQAQIVMKIVDPQVALAMLYRQSDQIPPLLPSSTAAPVPPDVKVNGVTTGSPLGPSLANIMRPAMDSNTLPGLKSNPPGSLPMPHHAGPPPRGPHPGHSAPSHPGMYQMNTRPPAPPGPVPESMRGPPGLDRYPGPNSIPLPDARMPAPPPASHLGTPTQEQLQRRSMQPEGRGSIPGVSESPFYDDRNSPRPTSAGPPVSRGSTPGANPYGDMNRMTPEMNRPRPSDVDARNSGGPGNDHRDMDNRMREKGPNSDARMRDIEMRNIQESNMIPGMDPRVRDMDPRGEMRDPRGGEKRMPGPMGGRDGDYRGPPGPPQEMVRPPPNMQRPMGAPPSSSPNPTGPAGGSTPGSSQKPPGATKDQEKAALIMQVLQLSDTQISMLPADQRQSILILKEQIARSGAAP